MRIKAEDTMALIIDYQEKLVPVIDNNEELINNSRILIEGLKVLGIPMIVTEQYKKGLGETVGKISEIFEEIKPPTFDKTSFSCGDDEDIIAAIKEQGKKNIIICGIEAHICVLQSVLDLSHMGYQTILISDCIGSRRALDKEVGIKRMAAEGAILSTYESILFELTRKAKGDTFKAISRLIK